MDSEYPRAVSRYSGDLQRAEFVRADLSGAQFRLSELAGVVMRGVNLDGADIDGWVGELRIKGVDVGPLVEAELVRRDPARGLQHATDPAGLRAAWAMLKARYAPS